MAKQYDLVIKTGEYTNNNGETKGRYENIGAVMQGDNGPYMMLKKTFNPAGAPCKEGRDSILISMFEPKQQGQQHQGQQSAPQQNTSNGHAGFDDDVPW